MRRLRPRHSCLKLFILMVLALAADAGAQTVVLVPSDGAGGGNLVLRVHVPPAGPRFSSGAPVVIAVEGGFGSGSFRAPPAGLLDAGIAFVTFLWPGGVSGPFHSDGVYDDRGPNCILALRDVLQFAAGARNDAAGLSLEARAGMDVDEDQIGLLTLSNGGNVAAVTLALEGAAIPACAFIVGWENPTGAQNTMSELGRTDPDTLRDGDGNGIRDDDYVNPFYLAYGDTLFEIDYGRIAFDPVFTEPGRGPGAFLLDGSGDGRVTTIPIGGAETTDLDLSGLLETDEDYLLGSIWNTAHTKRYPTPLAAQALEDHGVFTPGSWPAEIATPQESADYWRIRDATWHYDAIAAGREDLAVILLFSLRDHVQVNRDKPHVRQAYRGFTRSGAWVRLNPDAAYVRSLEPSYTAAPDNDALAEPADWYDIGAWSEPEAFALGVCQTAAVLELVDRRHAGVWTPNLSGVLTGVDATAGGATPAEGVVAAPNPAGAAVVLRVTVERVAVVSASIFDVRGRRVRAFASAAAGPGRHEMVWDGRTDEGIAAPSGLYLARLETAGRSTWTKIVLSR